jgi:hypothetical protein
MMLRPLVLEAKAASGRRTKCRSLFSQAMPEALVIAAAHGV